MRGNAANLLNLYSQARPIDIQEGTTYYDRQSHRISTRAAAYDTSPDRAIAAFAVLSPNNAENQNYRALEVCLRIVTGDLPTDHPTPCYPINKFKALALLVGGEVSKYVVGQKVRSFYHNTLDPDDNHHVTIDGHMLGAWIGRRVKMKDREASIGRMEYEWARRDMVAVGEVVGLSGPRLQAVLWLVWKRVNGVLYDPQMRLFD